MILWWCLLLPWLSPKSGSFLSHALIQGNFWFCWGVYCISQSHESRRRRPVCPGCVWWKKWRCWRNIFQLAAIFREIFRTLNDLKSKIWLVYWDDLHAIACMHQDLEVRSARNWEFLVFFEGKTETAVCQGRILHFLHFISTNESSWWHDVVGLGCKRVQVVRWVCVVHDVGELSVSSVGVNLLVKFTIGVRFVVSLYEFLNWKLYIHSIQRIPVHQLILQHHPDLSTHMYYCFMNGHPYFTIITGKVNYCTIKRCKGRGKIEGLRHLGDIVNTHNRHGLKIGNCHGDNEFKKLKRDLELVCTHTGSRQIWTHSRKEHTQNSLI